MCLSNWNICVPFREKWNISVFEPMVIKLKYVFTFFFTVPNDDLVEDSSGSYGDENVEDDFIKISLPGCFDLSKSMYTSTSVIVNQGSLENWTLLPRFSKNSESTRISRCCDGI